MEHRGQVYWPIDGAAPVHRTRHSTRKNNRATKENFGSPGDMQGTYSVISAGGALAAGAGGVQLQNEKGVILQLHGPKVGVELSAAVGGVQIALR
jgi:hypothetical protein